MTTRSSLVKHLPFLLLYVRSMPAKLKNHIPCSPRADIHLYCEPDYRLIIHAVTDDLLPLLADHCPAIP